MNYNNYYIAVISLHEFEKPILSTKRKIRYYDDEIKASRYFNGSNYEEVIMMKLAYDDNYSNYTVDNIIHISL